MPDGRIDESSVPVWVSVADGQGLIIGYIKFPWPEPSPDGPTDPGTIYDEDGQPIGSMVDGSPVVTVA